MARAALLMLALLLVPVRPVYAEGTRGDLAFSTGDYATALVEWHEAANGGDASAMEALGMLYDTGHGVGQDFAAALDWYRRAGEAGSVRGMFNVGSMYDNGRGTTADRQQAIAWYERAANQGSGRAAYSLGVIYRDGDQVPKDKNAAIKFFRLAADAGIPAARQNLAALNVVLRPSARPAVADVPLASNSNGPPYRDMVGSPPSSPETEAIGRFQQAALARSSLDASSTQAALSLIPVLKTQAQKGNPLALYDMGFAFEHGLGVAADPVASYVSYLKAASQEGNAKAAALRGAAEVGRRLTPQQHGLAREMLMDAAW